MCVHMQCVITLTMPVFKSQLLAICVSSNSGTWEAEARGLRESKTSASLQKLYRCKPFYSPLSLKKKR